jgi:flap endonuclease-1
MGVKLQDIITRVSIDYHKLLGTVIAIDAPNIIMGLFNFALKNHEGLILDRTQRPISHLYGLLYRVNFLYSKKIIPLFCFDGKPSVLKRLITKDQLKDFLFTQKWYTQAMCQGRKEDARVIALSKEYMWQNIIKESKQLLGALGVPYIESPASAESQCAYLVKKGIVTYSNSQDFDSLLFGAPRVVQNVSKSLRRKVQGRWQYTKITPSSINLIKDLQRLEINQFQLVDLALMIRTDYFPGIKGIGPKTALHLIKKYSTIEKVKIHECEKYDFSSLTHPVIQSVRKLFLFPEIIQKFEDFYWNTPDRERIHYLLCEEHFLNEERVMNNLKKLQENFKRCRTFFTSQKTRHKGIQTTLDTFP